MADLFTIREPTLYLAIAPFHHEGFDSPDLAIMRVLAYDQDTARDALLEAIERDFGYEHHIEQGACTTPGCECDVYLWIGDVTVLHPRSLLEPEHEGDDRLLLIARDAAEIARCFGAHLLRPTTRNRQRSAQGATQMEDSHVE